MILRMEVHLIKADSISPKNAKIALNINAQEKYAIVLFFWHEFQTSQSALHTAQNCCGGQHVLTSDLFCV